MRWPFLFGRASVAKGLPKSQAPVPVREWASLPPIQRVVGEPRLTAPTTEFLDSLAGTHEPDTALAPLGHLVSLEGPSGLVGGLTRHVEVYAPSHELVGRPTPRREATAQRRLSSAEEAAVEPASDVEPEPEPEPSTMTFAAIDEPVPHRAPLTRMTDSGADAVLRLAMPRPAQTNLATIDHGPASDAPAPEIARSATAQRLTLGQSRRLGLGAPLSQRRPPPSVQRSVDTTSLGLAPPDRTARADRAESGSGLEIQPANHEQEVPLPPAMERIGPVAGAMIQRRAEREADGPAPAAGLRLVPAAGSAPIETPMAPDRAAIQRAVAWPLPPLFPRPGSAPTVPLVSSRPPLMTVRPESGSDEVATGGPAPMMLQRLPAFTPGEPALPVAPAGIAPAPPYRERATPDMPSPRAPLTLAPVVPAVQRVHPAVQDFVAYSPFATTPSLTASTHPAAAVSRFPVQREVSAGEAPSPEPTVASSPVAGAASAGASAGAALAEAVGPSEKELDELARKLHDRISLNLRRDLLIQRERAGMVTDLR